MDKSGYKDCFLSVKKHVDPVSVCMCLCILNWCVSVFWSNVFLNTWYFYTCYLENAVGLAFGEEQMRSSLQPVPESEAEDEGAGWMFFIVQGQGAQVAKKLTSGWVLVFLKGKIWDYLVSTFNISCIVIGVKVLLDEVFVGNFVLENLKLCRQIKMFRQSGIDYDKPRF